MGLSAGTMVTDRIRLERLLGEGGMGSVWVAEHLTLGTKVAVKFVSPELSTKHPELHARFLREAAAAAKINSPHVVRTFDFGAMPDGTPFLVMELLEGESLADRLQREKALPPGETALVIGQVAKALSEAHRLGVVHRDIKPGNIFLMRSGRDLFAKVLDFGIAKDTAEHTQSSSTKTGFALGTPQYMSPEQLMSAKAVDLQADLWALAVTAYETVTGTPPFRGETVPHLIVSIHAQKFEAPSSLQRPPVVPNTAALDQFFARAFATDKDRRFTSALELADALSVACNDSSSAPASTAAARTVYGAPVEEPIATAATEPQPRTTLGAPLEPGPTAAGPSTPIAEPLPMGTGTQPGAPTAVSGGAEAPRGTRVGSNTVVPDRASSAEGPKPVALTQVRAESPEKSRTALYVGGTVGVGAVGVVLALALGGSSKKETTPIAAPTGESTSRAVAASEKPVASVAPRASAPPSASASSEAPSTADKGHVADGTAGSTFVPAFDWKRASAKSRNVVEAMRVCRDLGTLLCTEAQYSAACATEGSIASDAVLVAAPTPTFSTIRGGGSCDSKQPSGSQEAGVLCCTDAVGVVADDDATKRTWAKRLTDYQTAQNNHDTAKLASEFYADDVTWGGSQFTRDGIQKEAARFFKGSPSVYQLYARCQVTKTGPNKKARCETALDYRSSLGAHTVVQTLVFNGDDKLVSVSEESTTKLQ